MTPLYVFHLCSEDGASPAFEAFELTSDDEVLRLAIRMLGEHASCDHVEVWRGDEFVLRLDRNATTAQDLMPGGGRQSSATHH